MLRAMNLLLARPSGQFAVAAAGNNGRILTAVPWCGLTLVGTHQSAQVIPPEQATATASDLDEMIAEVNSAFPALRATRAEVRLIHQGLTPAVRRDGRVDLQPESEIVSIGSKAAPVFAIVGVKYTTARQTAERVVNLVQESLQARFVPSATATSRLPHAGLIDEAERARFVHSCRDRLDLDVIDHLLDWYGTEAPAVLSLALSLGLTDRLTTESAVISGEVAYAVRSAQALRLGDVVLRRTPLGSAGHPGLRALERAADVMQPLLGWSLEQRAREIAAVDAFYRLPARPIEPRTP
jgi:glycerol-3-phosphate dehydrogenase